MSRPTMGLTVVLALVLWLPAGGAGQETGDRPLLSETVRTVLDRDGPAAAERRLEETRKEELTLNEKPDEGREVIMSRHDEAPLDPPDARRAIETAGRPVSRRESLKLASAVVALAPGLGIVVREARGREVANGLVRLAWYTTADGREFREVASQELPQMVAKLASSDRGPRFRAEWFLVQDGEKKRIHSEDLPSVMMKVEF